jgi:uncharacterized protein (TIGR03067 family)
MKLVAMCILVAGLVAAAADDKVKKEQEALQGTWTAESVEANGEKPDAAQGLVVIIQDDKMTFKLQDKQITAATAKIDPSLTPKLIDLTFTAGENKGQTWEGIYTLEGDTFKFCISLIEKQRPSEFATKADSNAALIVLKREKS